ncbi:MAG: Eco57I restriction-modification methylase domain-containing protein [Proteobacteria bacterium]|nr:Eco57I restriction-modification methylase domain-containing protein [Pseudomonadota bacterium]
MELGVVYTPRAVVDPLVAITLAPLVHGRSSAAVLDLRICDFALGEGVFLVAAVDYLVARLGELHAAGDPTAPAPDRARALAERCVTGVDIDARAVACARAALPGADLRVADALVCAWGDVRFDAVLGNPPYIRQELIADKAALRAFAVYDGVADLYVYFIELAHRIADRFGLVVPSKWMTAHYGRPLRRFLAAAGSVEGIVDCGASTLFATVDAFPCLVWGATGGPTRATPIRASRLAGASVAEALAAPGLAHERARWSAEPWHIDHGGDRALIDRLARAHPPLREVVPQRPSRGVVTGYNAAFTLDRATRDALLVAEPAAAALVRPLVKGRDVRPYDTAPIERWILLIEHGTSLAELPHVRAHLGAHHDALTRRKPGTYAWYELQDPIPPLVKSHTPRLLYQDIQSQPACALDRTGALVPDTTVWMLPTDDLVILAILNSSLYHWYARRRFPPALGGAVRPKAAYIGSLPIAQPPPDLRRAIEAAVARREHAALDALVADAYGLSRAERRDLGTRGVRCVTENRRASGSTSSHKPNVAARK